MYNAATMNPAPDQEASHRRPAAENKPLQRSSAAGYQKGLLMGSLMIGPTVGFLGLGWLIDSHAGSKPTWTILLGGIGIVLGLYLVIREGMRQ
jgi:F0F1-type ATP synthase assembly protein I